VSGEERGEEPSRHNMSRERQRKLDELERRAELAGGEERLQRQRAAGKLTARQRIELLFDAGTFEEIDKFVTHRCLDFGMAACPTPTQTVS